jgi:hypothetical protein
VNHLGPSRTQDWSSATGGPLGGPFLERMRFVGESQAQVGGGDAGEFGWSAAEPLPR